VRRLRVLPAVWLLVLLAAPAVAWLLGARQPLLENHPKASFPAVNRSSLGDPATFARLDSALFDQLPLRQTALDLHTRIELDLFHHSPNPQVALGRNGWLYYMPELNTCRPEGKPIGDPADAWEMLARTLRAAGYRPIVAAPGSKLLIHARDAPTLDDRETRCVRALERHIAARLAEIPGGLSIDAQLRRLEATGRPTFLRDDSHWNWRGRELFARRLLEDIDPRLARAAHVRAGRPYERHGDLAALVGIRRSEQDRLVVADPPQWRPARGDVVLIGDSQLDRTLVDRPVPGVPSLRELLLADQPACEWQELGAGVCDEQLRRARTVLLEKVARDVQLVTLVCWRPLAIAAERLGRGTAIGWERLGAGGGPIGQRLTIPASGSVTIRVHSRADDTAARLLRFRILRDARQADGTEPPVQLVQHPRAGPAAPCATPASVKGGSLLLPLPSGRRGSDVELELRSAPGSQIGRPHEIRLDGTVSAARR
jgi:hypothetical protein